MSGKTNLAILFLCTGNTCRSPMAEGIAKKITAEYNLDNFKISSAGTGAIDGMPATDNAIAAARHWDIDISSHRSRSLKKEHIKEADLILVMGSEHAEAVLKLDRGAENKIFMLRGFPKPFSALQERVDDPIGSGMDQYNQTFLELDEALRKIFPRLVEFSRKK
jgi:protein-tyrosine-phosphatase